MNVRTVILAIAKYMTFPFLAKLHLKTAKTSKTAALHQSSVGVVTIAVPSSQDGSPLEVQVEVDTGMSRYGVQPQDLGPLMGAIAKAGVRVRSLYTHFQASISRLDLNMKQLDAFLEATKPFP